MKFAALKVFAAASLLATFAASVSAGTATSTMAVSATVVPKCTIDSVTALTFGTYIQESGNIDQAGAVNLTCPVGTNYTIGIDGVLAGNVRNMTFNDVAGPHYLEYNLFTDAVRTQIWGPIGGPGGTVTLAGTGNGASATLPVYGRIVDSAANRLVPAGNYNAVVTITVTY
jgi:spore coat protein U-like protein